MEEQAKKLEPGAKTVWPRVMSWVGGATALIGFFASVGGGVTWLLNHHRQQTERQAKFGLAQAQAKQGEYQASVQTYGEILKADPLYRPALDQQLDTAMLWVEDFHALVPEGQSATSQAGPALDEIMAVLDAGFARTKGPQAADVQAHIGWTHWLNQHIAEREFGAAAEQNFRAALAADQSNVYANSMLGNWMLQNNGDFDEAIHHLDVAVSTGRARPFVRRLQIGGLIDLERRGARAAQVKAANDMRKSGEPLDDGYKKRILTFCFDPMVANHMELAESLSAVPPDEAWETYLWLDKEQGEAEDHSIAHEFVNANLLEISGKQQESLEKYRTLKQQLKDRPGTMQNAVDQSIARISRAGAVVGAHLSPLHP